jgi:hypothetical protein
LIDKSSNEGTLDKSGAETRVETLLKITAVKPSSLRWESTTATIESRPSNLAKGARMKAPGFTKLNDEAKEVDFDGYRSTGDYNDDKKGSASALHSTKAAKRTRDDSDGGPRK